MANATFDAIKIGIVHLLELVVYIYVMMMLIMYVHQLSLMRE